MPTCGLRRLTCDLAKERHPAPFGPANSLDEADAPPRISSFGMFAWSRAPGRPRRPQKGAGDDLRAGYRQDGPRPQRAVDERGAEMCRPMPFDCTEVAREGRRVAEGLAGSPSDVVVGMEATGDHWMAVLLFRLSGATSNAGITNPMAAVKAVRKSLDNKNRIDAWLIAETLRIGQYDETKRARHRRGMSLRSLSRYLQYRCAHGRGARPSVCLMDANFLEYADILGHVRAASRAASKSLLPFELARRRADSLAATSPRRPGAAGSRRLRRKDWATPRPGRRSA